MPRLTLSTTSSAFSLDEAALRERLKSRFGDKAERILEVYRRGRPGASPTDTAWAAFARAGNPSHSDIPDWPPYDPHRRATMILDAECRVVDDPHREERLLWEQLA
jgi:carboxylesterase type B